MLALSSWIMLEIPQFAKEMVNLLSMTEMNSARFDRLAWAMVGFGVAQILIRSMSRLFLFWPGRNIEAQAKIDIFKRTLLIQQQFIQKLGLGDLVSRMANDVTHLRVFFAFGVLQLANLVFLSVFIVAKMVSTNIQLAVLTLLPLGLMLVISRMIMPKFQEFSRKNQQAVGLLTNKISETIARVHVLQAYNAEKQFIDRVEIDNEQVYQTNMGALITRNVLFPLISFLSGISQIVILGYGGYLVIQEQISVGDILAFNIYVASLSFPLTAVGIILSTFQRAKTALVRMDEIMAAPTEETSGGANVIFSTAETPLKIHNLTFSFEHHEVLKNINFEIKKGEHFGIFGTIASGKTTLFNLLTRIYDPPKDSIFLKGHDIAKLDVKTLRQQIHLVEQTSFLFSESIRENLTYGGPKSDVTYEKILQNAMIYDEVMGFAQGLETTVGERGLRLSGGQKQRLALARAFARVHEVIDKESIFLLDDVLSAVDEVTEANILKVIAELNQTALIISSKISVLKHCSRILVLKDGYQIGLGSYEEIKHLMLKSDG